MAAQNDDAMTHSRGKETEEMRTVVSGRMGEMTLEQSSGNSASVRSDGGQTQVRAGEYTVVVVHS
eukprot:scaffold7504_cov97-Cylindrotheca_fusiformis.AAC.7